MLLAADAVAFGCLNDDCDGTGPAPPPALRSSSCCSFIARSWLHYTKPCQLMSLALIITLTHLRSIRQDLIITYATLHRYLIPKSIQAIYFYNVPNVHVTFRGEQHQQCFKQSKVNIDLYSALTCNTPLMRYHFPYVRRWSLQASPFSQAISKHCETTDTGWCVTRYACLLPQLSPGTHSSLHRGQAE